MLLSLCKPTCLACFVIHRNLFFKFAYILPRGYYFSKFNHKLGLFNKLLWHFDAYSVCLSYASFNAVMLVNEKLLTEINYHPSSNLNWKLEFRHFLKEMKIFKINSDRLVWAESCTIRFSASRSTLVPDWTKLYW